MANASHVGTLPLSRILSLYPRERLFVHPLIWTQRQLDLLGCTFHFSNCDNNDDDDDEENSETPQKWTPAKTLVESNEFVDKLLVMEDLWYGLYGERWFLAREMYFYFARRRVARLECRAYSLITPLDEDDCPPANHVAWLDVEEIALLRKRKIYHARGDIHWDQLHLYYDAPFLRRAKKLLGKATPPDPLRDPFMVAMLIALAQSQRLSDADPKFETQQQQRRVDEHGAYWRAVLMVTGTGYPWLYIYGAHISVDFLDGLDNPNSPSPSPKKGEGSCSSACTGLKIDCRRLRAKPYDTLPQRMKAALLESYQTPRTGKPDVKNEKVYVEDKCGEARQMDGVSDKCGEVR